MPYPLHARLVSVLLGLLLIATAHVAFGQQSPPTEPAPAQPAAPAAEGSTPPAANSEPAAEPPATTPAPAAAPVPATAGNSFARLADPAVAERLKLSDEQRVQIASLQTDRAAALAQAAPEGREAVARQYEEKLLAILTAEQRAGLAQADAGDVKLRFNFRFQRWSDVLEWFAGQANMSLVLDAPPPGTFNYSDNRQYTVPEALDLLNGVLLTKGFTLIRRDRILLLVDLAEGIPETLVPRVELSDLDKRGRFELVSVMFPIEKRDAQEVVTEIAPLLSPRGKSLALPKTRQVLVTDTAGVMRAIQAVIASMPLPEKPREEGPKEKPELVVYPLKSADPDAAVKVLESLMPDGRFVRDPKANQISAYATPTQQKAVARVLEQMQTGEGPAERQSRFEVYPLDEADPKQALAALQPLTPNARLSVDPVTKKLAAWGTPADHEILKKAVEQLGGGGPAGTDDRQVEVYRLTKAEPTAALTMLQSIVPRAKLAVDATSKSIVALASLEDQKTIRATLEQMEPSARDPNAPELRFYPLAQKPPANLTTIFQTLAPQAQITVDATNNRLSVVARPADHAVVERTLEQLNKSPGDEEKRELALYPVSDAERKRFSLMLTDLTSEFPGLRVLTDAEPGELAIWAKPAEHKVLAEMIEKLKQDTPATQNYQLVAYPIRTADPSSVYSVLQSLFPGTKLVLDVKSRRLVVWTRPTEQASIKTLIEQMDTDEPAETSKQLMVYPVHGFDPSAALVTLRTLAPDATMTPDSRASTIVVWARKSEQAQIAAALERMKPEPDPERRPRVVAYPVAPSDPATLYPLVATLVPTARVVPNAKNGTLAVWATPEEHETIRAAIEEMKSGSDDPARRPRVVAYPVAPSDPATLYPLVATLVPTARVVPNAKNGTIAVWATPEEHETIRAAIEEMKSGTNDPERRPRVVAYPVGSSDPATLYPLVSALVPTARVVPNMKNGTIAVWATPEEHETIAAAIKEMTSPENGGNGAKVQVYTLQNTSAYGILSALQSIVPEARLGMGLNSRKLVALARPADHETIRTALAELDQEDTVRTGVEMKAYPLTTAEPSSLLNTLEAMFGSRREARISLDSKNNKLIAIASPAQHEIIRGVIEEIERGSPLDQAAQMEAHPLRNADPDVALQVLNNLVVKQSRAVLSVDPQSRQLIAVAPPAQQKVIRETIDQLQTAQRELDVFQLEMVDPLTAELAIDKLFGERSNRGRNPQPAPIVDSDPGLQRLYVRATREQLSEIRDLLVKMGESRLAAKSGAGGSLRVIPFTGDTQAALAEIQRVWPRMSKSPLRVLGSPNSPLPTAPNRTPPPAPPAPEAVPEAPPAQSPPTPLDKQTQAQPGRTVEVLTAAQDEQPAEQPAGPATEPQPVPQAPPAPQAPANAEPSPIIVAPGDGKLTIMSDDPEALEQFEALARALSPPAGPLGGRDVMVYPLRSASSTSVAELLNRIFRRNTFDATPAVIEADARLNAVIVYAGRNDRAMIERLIKTLDSEEVPESLVANRPTLIPVHNTSATRVDLVLREVYKSQLTSGSMRQPPIPIPSGASRDMAAVIMQINAAASGPLMTLGIDDTTNSIVVMAPGPLVKEVRELIAELDEAALNDTSRGVKIVKLKNTNAMTIKGVLDAVIKDATQRQRSRR